MMMKEWLTLTLAHQLRSRKSNQIISNDDELRTHATFPSVFFANAFKHCANVGMDEILSCFAPGYGFY